MNWSVYSRFVGNVFGAPLAIEGLAAFFLEATFLGLWIFGWNRLSPRVHLATIWLVGARHVALGLLHPRRQLVDAAPRRLQGQQRPARELTSVWALLTNKFALWALRPHDPRRSRPSASVVVLGVACWHFVRGSDARPVPARREARADRAVPVRPSTSGSAATSGSSRPSCSR